MTRVKNPCYTRVREHPGTDPCLYVMSDADLIINTDRGLYCPAGDFFIDAWRPVNLTIVRWRDPQMVADEINHWWRKNVELERTSLLLAYTLGKSQRVLSLLDAQTGPILLHGATFAMVEAYREAGVPLPPAEYATAENAKLHKRRALV